MLDPDNLQMDPVNGVNTKKRTDQRELLSLDPEETVSKRPRGRLMVIAVTVVAVLVLIGVVGESRKTNEQTPNERTPPLL